MAKKHSIGAVIVLTLGWIFVGLNALMLLGTVGAHAQGTMTTGEAIVGAVIWIGFGTGAMVGARAIARAFDRRRATPTPQYPVVTQVPPPAQMSPLQAPVGFQAPVPPAAPSLPPWSRSNRGGTTVSSPTAATLLPPCSPSPPRLNHAATR